MYSLYSLVDPISNQIRYIGITKTPKERYWDHLSRCKTKEYNTYKGRWIRKLLDNNLKPIYKCLVQCKTLKEVAKLEIDFIKYYKQFYKLTNTTKGGEGVLGYKHTIETRNKLSKSHIGVPHLYQRYKIEALNIKTNEYIIFNDIFEAIKYIKCSISGIRDVSSGKRNSVNEWLTKSIKNVK